MERPKTAVGTDLFRCSLVWAPCRICKHSSAEARVDIDKSASSLGAGGNPQSAGCASGNLRHSEVPVRSSFWAGLLLTFLAVPLSLAASEARQNAGTDGGSCRHRPIVNGFHIQPSAADVQCAQPLAKPRRKASDAGPVDADDAYIRDILERYERFHIDDPFLASDPAADRG